MPATYSCADCGSIYVNDEPAIAGEGGADACPTCGSANVSATVSVEAARGQAEVPDATATGD